VAEHSWYNIKMAYNRKRYLITIILSVLLICFLSVLSFGSYIYFTRSISSIQKGQNLGKATEVTVKEYFDDFFINNLAINSSLSENSYTSVVWYTDQNYIYYGINPSILGIASSFKKIRLESLKQSLPFYNNPEAPRKLSNIVGNYIETNKKEYFDLNICKYTGENNLGYDVEIISEGILYTGSIDQFCNSYPVNSSPVTKKASQTYSFVISTKDFSIISHEWKYGEIVQL